MTPSDVDRAPTSLTESLQASLSDLGASERRLISQGLGLEGGAAPSLGLDPLEQERLTVRLLTESR